MKKIKILISMLLCAVMVLGTVAVGGDGFAEVLDNMIDTISVKASAATLVDSGTCGDDVRWSLSDDGVLTISGTGEMYDYSSPGGFYGYGQTIKTVIIGNEVTYIGERAFYNCSSLTSVIIPGSVTGIGVYAFYGCVGLKSAGPIGSECNYEFGWINEIPSYAFWGCTGLISITIPDSITNIGIDILDGTAYYDNEEHWENDSLYLGKFLLCVKDVFEDYKIKNGTNCIAGSAFDGCESLKGITIPDTVKSIGDSAFEYCTRLTSVTIPDSVTSIGERAFAYCSSLRCITISNSITSIAYEVFIGCTGLTSVTIPDGVTSIGSSSFAGCTGLTSLTIPHSVISIYWGAFYDCTGLTSVTIPDSVTSIGISAFRNCTGLTSFTIPNSVTSIGGSAFRDCTGLTSLTIPDSVKSIDKDAFQNVNNVSYSKNMTATGSPWGAKCVNGFVDGYLVYSDSSKTKLCGCISAVTGSICILNSVTSIENLAFYNCTGLTSITIPSSVTRIGSYAFYKCAGLTSITIPDSVKSIGACAFEYCTSLTGVTIPNGITSIDYELFCGCSSLTSVIIPNSVNTVGEKAFAYCSGLTSITIPSSVTSIGRDAFDRCTGLTSVTIPDSITTIDFGAFGDVNNIIYSDNMKASGSPWDAKCANGYVDGYLVYIDSSKTKLCGCISIATGSILIPNSVTSIGDRAFYNCTGLTSITIPSSVTSIGSYAFCGCDGLTGITIPDSVTNISENAFYVLTFESAGPIGSDCDIEFGWTENIPSNAFYGCENLTSIIIPKSVISIGDQAFWSCDGLTSIIIPDGVKSIGYGAFSYCTSLEYVHIPASVTSIGSLVLYYTHAYVCSDTGNCYARKNLEKAYGFKLCDGHEIHSHSYTSSVTKPATCKEEGVMTYTCECGDSYTETISKVVHTPKDVTIPATCKQMGAKYTVCEVCGDTIGDVKTLPLADHKFSDWKTTKSATCMVDGEKSRSCSICGKVETETIKSKGHIPGEWVVDTEATTEHTGKKVQKCTVCGQVINEEVIPKIAVETIKDEDSGVELAYPDIYGDDVKLSVEEVFSGIAFNLVNVASSSAENVIFDIKMLVNGMESQPSGKVTVKIPLPGGYEPNKSYVYHIDTSTGKIEKMDAHYENGFVIFETTHFSYYAVVEGTLNLTANAKIKVASAKTVDYRNIITITATATEVPEGYHLALYVNGAKVKDGDNKSVSYTYGEIKSDINYTVKVVDSNGIVQKDSSGNDLSKDSRVTVNAGFFKKLVAFFKGLFGALPKVEVKP